MRFLSRLVCVGYETEVLLEPDIPHAMVFFGLFGLPCCCAHYIRVQHTCGALTCVLWVGFLPMLGRRGGCHRSFYAARLFPGGPSCAGH